tara:strand:+ start:377 stop:1084 length:708 start_codon:yes stop_codon:yes gene_type:complete
MNTRKVRKSRKSLAPTLKYEKSFWEQGIRHIVGVDEVGKGAWAGPLTVVAAMIPQEKRIYKIRDSKLLKEVERESLFSRISEWCETWAVGHATNEECDELGMSDAQKLATRRAIEDLSVQPDHFLIDGKWDFVGHLVGVKHVTKIVKGDSKCLSIASASVLAKVIRDRMMRDYHSQFPHYKFADNKGYPSPHHIEALHDHGPCDIHRKSWAFMDQLSAHGVTRMRRPNPQGTLFP